ncbi:MAG: hypothetical protein M1831_005388 [Alyxoria varia]|nr:MAG: hypothetical protein M1831_005388 [Alyxoria varia]
MKIHSPLLVYTLSAAHLLTTANASAIPHLNQALSPKPSAEPSGGAAGPYLQPRAEGELPRWATKWTYVHCIFFGWFGLTDECTDTDGPQFTDTDSDTDDPD